MNSQRFDKHTRELAPLRPRRLVNTGAEWVVNVSAACALHESGLVVSFTRLQAKGAGWDARKDSMSLGICWAPGGYPVWGLSADSAALRDTLAAFDVADQSAATRFVQTLSHEAREAWLLAWTHKPAARGAAPDAGPSRSTAEPASALAPVVAGAEG